MSSTACFDWCYRKASFTEKRRCSHLLCFSSKGPKSPQRRKWLRKNMISSSARTEFLLTMSLCSATQRTTSDEKWIRRAFWAYVETPSLEGSLEVGGLYHCQKGFYCTNCWAKAAVSQGLWVVSPHHWHLVRTIHFTLTGFNNFAYPR